MTMSIKEAMKKINMLQQQIDRLIQDEHNNNTITYIDESDKEIPEYSFEETNQKINDLNKEILSIRSAINKANQITKVGIKDYNISDALVRIAQLSAESSRYEILGNIRQKTRQTTYNGVVEYTEYVHDVKEAQALYLETVDKIHKLQTAVDKANILTEITI